MEKKIKEQQEVLEKYQLFIEEMAVNIIPVSETVGLISATPLPFDIDPQQFTTITSKALEQAKEMGLIHVIVDMSRITDVRMTHNIAAFNKMAEAFNLLGIELILTGIHPRVAMQAVQYGMSLKVRSYPKLLNAMQALQS